MRLRRQVNHRLGLVLRKNPTQLAAIADINLLESVPIAPGNLGNRVQIARISQLVDVNDGVIRLADDVANEGGADEAGSAGDEEGRWHRRPSVKLIRDGRC